MAAPQALAQPRAEAGRLGRLPDLHPMLDPAPLVVARFAAHLQPARLPETFVAVVRDAAELTMVCTEEALAGLDLADPPLALERGWRRVTFPGPLPWELVGFLADVAGRLAGAQIPFTSVSGFTTDHVLVREAQAVLAVSVLSGEPPPRQRPGTNP